MNRAHLLLCGMAVILCSRQMASATTSGTTLVLPDAPRWTLEQALTYARDHHPLIKAARARTAARVGEARVSRGQWFPKIGATAQMLEATSNDTTTEYISPTTLDQPRISGTRVTATGSFQPYASTYAGIGLRQQIYDFGRTQNKSAVADALTESEHQDSKAVWLEVELLVRSAFFGVQAAHSLFNSANAAFERSRVHRDMVQAAVKNGLRPPLDLTREEADLMRFDVERINTFGAIKVAEAEMAAAVGSTLFGIDSDQQEIEVPAAAKWPTSLDDVFAREPRIRAALARVRAQEARSSAAFSEFLPTLSLSAAFSGQEGGAPPSSGAPPRFNGFVPGVPNWDVGLIIAWPLYDQTNIARFRAAKLKEEVFRADVEVFTETQRAALQESFNVVDVSYQAIPALQRALDAAHDNYLQAEARFKAGLGTILDLADAEALLTDAEDRLILGRLHWARANAVFQRLLAKES